MKSFVSFLLTCFLSQGFSLSLSAQSSKKVDLQLKWYHQFQFAGYYAAKIKGFYKDEGLDVDLIEGNINKSPLLEVVNGHADFGVTGADILYDYIRGVPVVVTSVIYQHTPYVFMVLKQSGIRSPANLYKKRVMVSNDQGWLLLRALFFREGVQLDSVKLLKHSWNNKDLIAGKVDAISAYSTAEPYQFTKTGHDVFLISPRDYGLDFYGDLIFTTKDYARENPEVVEAFNRASAKGWEYALHHKEELIAYILALPGVKERGITQDNLEFEAKETEKLILSNLVEIGHINIGRFQNMLDVYKELKMVSPTASIEGLIFKKNDLDWERVSLIIIISAALGASLLLLIFIWNRRLVKTVDKKTKELQIEIESRKIAEKTARQSEERLKLAMKSANIGLWEWNVNTHEFTLSKEWCFLLGIDPSKLPMRKNIFDFIYPEDIPALRKAFNTSRVELKRLSMYELRLLKEGGGDINVLVSFRIIKVGGKKIKKLSGVVVNIDNIKKHEQVLRQLSEELMLKNRELKKFAYITSHNLRAPVVNIVSLMEMFDSRELQKENKLIFDNLDLSVNRLSNTLNDLIEIISSSANETPEFSTLDFNLVFEDTCNSIKVDLERVSPLIVKDFQVSNLTYSRVYLESVYLNLVVNAIKYRMEGRSLCINVSTFEDHDYVYLKITDNGIGIDLKKNKHRLFELYQRFEPQIEGKGMGLFLVKSQIESLSGKITVESEVGVGTAFTIAFLKKV
ncbi:ABC transporter substrate-binding protein [Pseudopedobacter beijingensis]|uniref:histidine kinase n=1 Tax=Pseudopedobacter beijingensis TaxID=1207056 RepID=A0ABW4IAE6_9SPHI